MRTAGGHAAPLALSPYLLAVVSVGPPRLCHGAGQVWVLLAEVVPRVGPPHVAAPPSERRPQHCRVGQPSGPPQVTGLSPEEHQLGLQQLPPPLPHQPSRHRLLVLLLLPSPAEASPEHDEHG